MKVWKNLQYPQKNINWSYSLDRQRPKFIYISKIENRFSSLYIALFSLFFFLFFSIYKYLHLNVLPQAVLSVPRVSSRHPPSPPPLVMLCPTSYVLYMFSPHPTTLHPPPHLRWVSSPRLPSPPYSPPLPPPSSTPASPAPPPPPRCLEEARGGPGGGRGRGGVNRRGGGRRGSWRRRVAGAAHRQRSGGCGSGVLLQPARTPTQTHTHTHTDRCT